jgi:hypothetical protein
VTVFAVLPSATFQLGEILQLTSGVEADISGFESQREVEKLQAFANAKRNYNSDIDSLNCGLRVLFMPFAG